MKRDFNLTEAVFLSVLRKTVVFSAVCMSFNTLPEYNFPFILDHVLAKSDISNWKELNIIKDSLMQQEDKLQTQIQIEIANFI